MLVFELTARDIVTACQIQDDSDERMNYRNAASL